MFRMIVASIAFAAVAADAAAVEDQQAKILKEQRFNSGDGRNGAAFATENGHIFREESDSAGNRIGQYSYVGDDGKTYTVKYSAGVDGFRILSGDHVPAGGQEAAAYDAQDYEEIEDAPLPSAPAGGQRPKAVVHPNFPARPRSNQPLPVRAPQPQRQPQRQQPQQAQQPQQFQRPQPQTFSAPLVTEQQRPQAFQPAPVAQKPAGNPFINPHDPTHRNFQFNKNAATFDPENPQVSVSSLVPDCADCAGLNPFVNPFDASHQAGGAFAGHLAGLGAGQQQQQQRPAPRRQAPVARPQQALPQRRAPASNIPTPSPAPRFLFPAGELKLNRFEDGFNFDFSS